MLQSFFIMTFDGEILIEKHWRGRIPRMIVEDWWTVYVNKATSIEEVLPVIATSKYYFVHIITNGLVFVAVLVQDTQIMIVLELLQQMSEVFVSYFETLSADTVKENFSIVFCLLDEMVDNGVPICTEPSVLRERVPPPTFMSRARAFVGVTAKKDDDKIGVIDGAASTTWRKPNIRYTSNEILFDIIEEVDAIIDSEGSIVMADIRGNVEAIVKLSGMPEVILSWANPEVFDDASIHPCVKHQKYEQDKSLVFTPPDGQFTVMSYHHQCNRSFTLPFYVKPQVSFNKDEGRVNVMVGLKSGIPVGKAKEATDSDKKQEIQKMEVTIPLPKETEGVRVDVNQGSYQYDAAKKQIIWKIGSVSGEATPSLSAVIQMPKEGQSSSGTGESVSVSFRMQGMTLSGLKVDNVNIYNEKYKAYKGVKYISKSGKFTVRT